MDLPVGFVAILGYGYNTVWTLLHNAEEVMIEVKKVEAVVHGAKHDLCLFKDLRLMERMDYSTT